MMKKVILISVCLSLFGCGGSSSDDGYDVYDLINASNAVEGKTVRPSDSELPLVVDVKSSSESIDGIIRAMESIESEVGYQVFKHKEDGETADIVIESSDIGCITSIPQGTFKYTVKVGDISMCKNITFDFVGYRVLGLYRSDMDAYKLIKQRTKIADSAIATIYNNQPGTKVSDLVIINK
ncbi:MAG: hypothetical protein WManBPW_07800 [Shewanella algae]